MKNAFKMWLTISATALSATGCIFDKYGLDDDVAPDAMPEADARSDAGPGSDAGDCDDGLACTDDVVVDGRCVNYDVCPVNKYCSAAGTCVTPATPPDAGVGSPDAGSTPSPHTLNCENVDGTRVTLTGNLMDGIVESLPGTPTYVSFGADTGASGWSAPNATLPKCSVSVANDGAASETWTCSGPISFGDSVQGFNFYVTNAPVSGGSGDVRWFQLSSWNVTGYCAKNAAGDKICSCDSLPCVSCPY